MRRLRVLVVDDVIDMAQTIANELEPAGFDVEVVDSGSVALDRCARHEAWDHIHQRRTASTRR